MIESAIGRPAVRCKHRIFAAIAAVLLAAAPLAGMAEHSTDPALSVPGFDQPLPIAHLKTALTIPPPESAAESNVVKYIISTDFIDGWTVHISWVRDPGPPLGEWFKVDYHWTYVSPQGKQGDGKNIKNEKQNQ